MIARKRITPQLISVLAAFSMAGFFLCSCGDEPKTITSNETSKEDPAKEEPVKEDPTPADSTADAQKDSIPNDTATVDSVHTITGYVNRGQMFAGTEVVLREVDSTLAQTGVVYRTVITDSLGAYSIPNVKLTHPYIHLEIIGRFNSICRESDTNIGSVEAYADVRKGDSIDINILTYIQAKRLQRYLDRGLSLDSALSVSQAEISSLFMLDTLREDFNKLNMVISKGDNYYLLGATVLSEGFYPPDVLDNVLEGDSLNDTTLASAWTLAYRTTYNTDCFKLTENVRKFGFDAAPGHAKKYLKDVWNAKSKIGECTPENYHEVTYAAYNDRFALYCDSSKWVQPHYCHEIDKIILNSSVGDTVAGHLTKAPHCQDTYYYWLSSNSEWRQADNVSAGLKLACVAGTTGRYGKSGKKCYHCNGSFWDDVEMSQCDEHLTSAEEE